jgi:hypothetical protein
LRPQFYARPRACRACGGGDRHAGSRRVRRASRPYVRSLARKHADGLGVRCACWSCRAPTPVAILVPALKHSRRPSAAEPEWLVSSRLPKPPRRDTSPAHRTFRANARSWAACCTYRIGRKTATQGVQARCRSGGTTISGEPGWDRTNDPLIKSQMLYR